MKYFQFVEDHQKKLPLNKFERVLVASKRAKDILNGKRPLVDDEESHKATSLAQYEVNNNLLEFVIKDKEDLVDEDFEEEGEE